MFIIQPIYSENVPKSLEILINSLNKSLLNHHPSKISFVTQSSIFLSSQLLNKVLSPCLNTMSLNLLVCQCEQSDLVY
jgi:hypothetical protein